MKICNKCHEFKPFVEFSKDNKRSDGLQSFCKSCAKQHYEDNKELYIKRAIEAKKRTIKRNFAFLEEFKKKPCIDCGNIFPPECMDFDHLTDDKLANISTLVRRTSIKGLLAEIAKCDLVCANCHRIRTKKRINAIPL